MSFDGSVPSGNSWLGKSTPDYDITPITPKLLAHMNVPRRGMLARDNPSLETGLASYIYRVGPRDVLSVTLWGGGDAAAAFAAVTAGSPSSQGQSTVAGSTGGSTGGQGVGFQVSPDGTIFFPYVGRVDVAGRTVEEIAQELTKRLRPIINNPQISVSVTGYNSQKFQLAGAVTDPKVYPLTNVPLTVSDAIALGGGSATGATGTDGGDLSHVIYIHHHKSQVLDIRNFLRYGDASQDRLVSQGDVIFVPDASSEQVHILGEVKTPGNYPMPSGDLNLTEALGNAGGLDLTSANPARIFVFRGSYQKPQIYWLDASSPDAMLLGNKFELHPQDVVYVATAGLVSWDRFLTQLLPTIQAIYFTRALVR